jgi:hypothetical protein
MSVSRAYGILISPEGDHQHALYATVGIQASETSGLQASDGFMKP